MSQEEVRHVIGGDATELGEELKHEVGEGREAREETVHA